ncbi:MAG: DnaJ domain-containing protein [Deltaproteobacteria bacterium]|jgi:molecular chaperone DnaJ|nr:DnaJ domain-containing protein [Deltaproteobacteria bacterium]
MTLDPYKTLGVEKNASPDSIKKAYRNLARKYHPDVNPNDKSAEEKFKELSMAYDILSDPNKKAEYDNLGREAFFERGFNGAGYKPNFDSHSFSFDDIFADFFANDKFNSSSKTGRKNSSFSFGTADGGPFGNFGGFTKKATKGGDRELKLTLSFREAVNGTELTLELDMPEICSNCQGQGMISNGRGVRNCPECRGRGSVVSRQTIKAKVPAGIKDGQKIRLRGKGFPGENGGQPGDLNLIVQVSPDPVFVREGDVDLKLEKSLSLYDALLGGKIEVPTLSGPATLKIPAGTQNGSKFRLKGKGVNSGKKTGDLYVAVKVLLPTSISEEAKELLSQLKELAPVHIDN